MVPPSHASRAAALRSGTKLDYLASRAGQHNSEAHVRIRKGRMIGKGKTPGRAAIRVREIVSAPANDLDPDWIRRRALWIGHRATGQSSEPVLAPLPDVACHVGQSEGIRKFLPDRV